MPPIKRALYSLITFKLMTLADLREAVAPRIGGRFDPRYILGKSVKTIAKKAIFSLLFYCLGCGSDLTKQATTQDPLATPSIAQVLPQTITAGSQSTTLKITGTNFPSQAAILWNGGALATTVVDANTLSSTIASSRLATPATIQLQVQNTATMQESQAVPVTIAAANTDSSSPVAITVSILPQAVVSTAYSAHLQASGGTTPYSWSITSGSLPAGLTLTANTGIISGTPTSGGSYSFGVMAVDSSSPAQSATTTLALSVAAAPSTSTPLTISSLSIASGTIGSAYSAHLQASGGTTSYSWSITSGSLPAGLTLAANTGIISGTPTSSGSYSFGVMAVDSSSPAQSATTTLALSVAAAPSTSAPLTINSSSVTSGTIGSAYSAHLQASGGTTPYSWSITSGSLPAGLTLAANTGIISGTPTSSGTAAFTASISDSASPAKTTSNAFSLVVSPSAVVITSASTLPPGTVSSTYSTLLHATGGTPPYSWSVTSGSLPAGLALAANTGIISGTPTSSGNYSFGVTAVDSSSPAQSATTLLDLSLPSVNTLSNLQSSGGWKSSGQLAPRYDDCTDTNSCSGVTWSMSQGVASPSLSGNAAAFNLGGTTPYSDVLFYNQLIGAFSTQGLPDNSHTLVPSVNNFTYDVYFYLSDAAHTQAMEFDINWFMNSVGITWEQSAASRAETSGIYGTTSGRNGYPQASLATRSRMHGTTLRSTHSAGSTIP